MGALGWEYSTYSKHKVQGSLSKQGKRKMGGKKGDILPELYTLLYILQGFILSYYVLEEERQKHKNFLSEPPYGLFCISPSETEKER